MRPDLIDFCIRILAQQYEKLFEAEQDVSPITGFTGSKILSASIADYMFHFLKDKNDIISFTTIIFAIIYIDRVIEKTGYGITKNNFHRLFLSAILLANKFYDDRYYSNKSMARLGGVTTNELNTLEIKFFLLIDQEFLVSVQEYEAYLHSILSSAKELYASEHPGINADDPEEKYLTTSSDIK